MFLEWGRGGGVVGWWVVQKKDLTEIGRGILVVVKWLYESWVQLTGLHLLPFEQGQFFIKMSINSTKTFNI